MKTNSKRPPTDVNWKRTAADNPTCGICGKELHWDQDIAGIDMDLGQICLECDPHLRWAIECIWKAAHRV
jgi:hypothetical protein